MKSLILAAGRGSRINEITKNHHKSLIKLKRKPLIKWQIDALNKFSTKTCIVTGYNENNIKKRLIQVKNITFIKNNEWQSSNMLYSLLCAKKWIDNDDLIVSYSDIFYSKSAIESLCQTNSALSILYDPNWHILWRMRFKNPLDDAETFKLDSFSFLREIGSRPKTIKECKGQFIGLIKISKKGWSMINEYIYLIKDKIKKIDTTTFLNFLISKGLKIEAVPISDTWGEVDTFDDYKLYKKLLRQDYFKWMK